MTQLSPPSRHSSVRKLIIGVGMFSIILVTLLVVPFFIDFSSFKPQIQSLISHNVNAKVDFQSARLQIVPSIGINVTGVTIENTDDVFKGHHLLTVDRVVVESKIFPLLSGKIVGNIRIDNPSIKIIKKGVKNNLLALVKYNTAVKSAVKSAESQVSAPPPTDKSTRADQPVDTAESFKDKIIIEGMQIDDAVVTISDLEQSQTITPVQITNLNLSISNIGLNRDIKLEADTEVDAKNTSTNLNGLIEIASTLRVSLGNNGIEKAVFKGKFSYDDLNINLKNVFVKKSGIPMNASFSGSFVPGDFIIEDLKLNLHTLNLAGNAHIVNFDDPVITANLTVDDNNIASLGDVLPQHKNMLLDGQLHLSAFANGRLNDPGKIEGKMDFNTSLAGTDLTVNLAASGIVPFRGNVTVKSNRMDIDSLLGPLISKSSSHSAGGSDGSPTSPATDFTLTDNQKILMAGTDADIRFDIKEAVYKSVPLTNVKIDLAQKNFITLLKQASFDGFDGKVTIEGRMDLESNPTTFHGNFVLNGIRPEQLMSIIKPEQKDLLTGHLNLELTLNGGGTTIPTLNKTLNGRGLFRILDGKLQTQSIASLMGTELDDLISKLSITEASESLFKTAENLLNSPIVKAAGKNPPDIERLRTQYQDITKVKFTNADNSTRSLKDVGGQVDVKDGKITILSSIVEDIGVLEFKSYVDLDMNLSGTSLYTAAESTKARLLSQSEYAKLLFDDKNNLVVPMTLGGTAMSPKVSIVSDTLKENFTKKSNALVEKDVKRAAEEFHRSLLSIERNSVDSATINTDLKSVAPKKNEDKKVKLRDTKK